MSFWSVPLFIQHVKKQVSRHKTKKNWGRL